MWLPSPDPGTRRDYTRAPPPVLRTRWRLILRSAVALLVLSVVSCTAAQVGKNQVVVVPREVQVDYRTGAVCRDGSRSIATGRGACSWHGGVAYWRFTKTEIDLYRQTWLSRNEEALRAAGWKFLLGGITLGIVGVLMMPSPPPVATTQHTPRPVPVPKRPPPQKEPAQKEPARHFGRCPRCDGWLIRRYRRRDRKPFKGCTAYPSCTFTEDLPKGARAQKRSGPQPS